MANPYGKYRLHLKNFRAIEEADITLDGITVVAGINACGKSTISRLFYETFRCARCFEKLVLRSFLAKHKELLSDLERISSLFNGTRGVFFDGMFDKGVEGIVFDDNGIEQIEVCKIFAIVKRLRRQVLENPFPVSLAGILPRWFRNWRNNGWIDKEYFRQDNQDWSSLLEEALRDIELVLKRKFEEPKRKILNRELSVFLEELKFSFKGSGEWGNFDIFDDDGIVTDLKNNFFAPITGVKQVFYCDAPWFSYSCWNREGKYGDQIRDILTAPNDFEEERVNKESLVELNRLFQDVARGSITAKTFWKGEEDDYETQFWYTQEGKTFRLQDCATGLKSVGLLQMLMNKGALTETTVVFLDEPEAYLHPEWIVEYARMLILINKTLGTRFFIATHNPDMTSAIRYISEKEGTLDSVNFYIAEESPTSKYQYRYREAREEDDEKSIGPLFESFVRGIEKIAEYSNPCGEQEDTSDE